MEGFVQMAGIQSVLFIYMLVGYLCIKFKILQPDARKGFTDFVIYITLPCMIFQSFDMELNMETLKNGAVALLLATAAAGVALVVGKFAYGWCKPNEKPIMQYGTLVSNSGFAGLPVVESAYGAEGLFLGSLFIIPTRILMWSAGISLFTTAPAKERFKSVMLNPGIIAVEVGIVRMLIGLQLPAQLDKALSSLGNCTTPLAMAIVGMILAGVELKTVFAPKAFVLVAVRQLLLPAIMLVFGKLVGIDPFTLGVGVVLTGMPIGSTTAILAAKYNADADFGSKCVFISTLTSLITVPILTLFL